MKRADAVFMEQKWKMKSSTNHFWSSIYRFVIKSPRGMLQNRSSRRVFRFFKIKTRTFMWFSSSSPLNSRLVRAFYFELVCLCFYSLWMEQIEFRFQFVWHAIILRSVTLEVIRWNIDQCHNCVVLHKFPVKRLTNRNSLNSHQSIAPRWTPQSIPCLAPVFESNLRRQFPFRRSLSEFEALQSCRTSLKISFEAPADLMQRRLSLSAVWRLWSVNEWIKGFFCYSSAIKAFTQKSVLYTQSQSCHSFSAWE